jgi:uncharacterized protein (DUF1697 family)
MPRHIAFLRAVNVGGRTVKMEELRKHFAALGLANAETLIASGNVIFDSAAKSAAALQKKIEDGLRKALGYDVKTFVRSAEEIAEVAKQQPFPAARAKTAKVLLVGFVEAEVEAATARKWMSFKSDVDDFQVKGRELYWLCQIGQSESPLFKVPIERVLGISITFRNMNTVRKIAEKVASRISK